MKVYSGSEIRNVALVGHNDTGKTTLVSQLLFNAGATTRQGRIEDGTTTTDFDQDEIERKHSISGAVALCRVEERQDQPARHARLRHLPDGGESRHARRRCGAVVVSGVTGVEVTTEKVWKFADEFELPRMVIINKMDRERASYSRTLDALQKKFGKNVVPIQLPIGEEKDFNGVIDLVAMKAYKYATDGSGKFETIEIPADLKSEADAARAALIEKVAEGDDTLMERFFEQGGLSQEELIDGLKREVSHHQIFPVLLRLRVAQHRRPRHPRCLRRASSAAGRGQDDRRKEQQGRKDHVRPPRRSVPGGAGLQDVLRSVLGTRIAVPRVLRHVQIRHVVLEHDQGSRRARRKTAAPAGQAAGSGFGTARRRHRRGRETQRRAHRRHAGVERTSDRHRAHRLSRSGDLIRDRRKSARRRRQDRHRSGAHHGRGSDDPPPSRRTDQGVPAQRPGAAPRRDRRFEVEEEIRRRRDPPSAESSVSRDDHQAGRCARTPQEAVRRSRSVRRLQDHDRAVAARRRLRVRRRDLRRLDSAPIHSGGRERNSGRAAERIPGGISRRRLPRAAARRAVSRRRFVRKWRSRLPDRWRSSRGWNRPNRQFSSRS